MVISFLGIDVKDFQAIYGPGREDLSSPLTARRIEIKFGAFQWEFGRDAMVIGIRGLLLNISVKAVAQTCCRASSAAWTAGSW